MKSVDQLDKKQSREAIVAVIRAQSRKRGLALSPGLLKLLSDTEEQPLEPDTVAEYLEQIGDEEDNVIELIAQYERDLPQEDRRQFRETIKTASENNDYLGGLLEIFERQEKNKPLLPRWAEIVVMFAIGIGLVALTTVSAIYGEHWSGLHKPEFFGRVEGWLSVVDGYWQTVIGWAILIGLILAATYWFAREFLNGR